MKITLYQIVPELDNDHLIFQSLQAIKEARGGSFPSELYEAVYSGEVDAGTLEEVFCIFNMAHPEGYRGRSLSVSDVVEVYHVPEGSEFFFCEPAGFARIEFRKNRTVHR